MKQRIALVAAWLCWSTMINAQPVFDSVAYVNRYSNLFPALQYGQSPHRPLTTAEKIAGLSRVWSEAKFGFANFDLVPRLNWDSAYEAFIPRVMAASTTREYYQLLKQFNQLLKDGHSRILEPQPLFDQNSFSIPWRVRCLEGKAIITGPEGSGKGSSRIQPGDEILAIEGVPIQDYIKRNIAPFIKYSTPQDSLARIYSYELLAGAANSQVKLSLKDKRGNHYQQVVTRSLDLRQTPPMRFAWLADSIAYVAINGFASSQIPEQFDSLFSTLSAAKGLIIDIRNNRGGNSNNGYEILGRLTDSAFGTNQTVFRKYNPAERAWGNAPFETEKTRYWWKPYKKPVYRKTVVVLTSAFTYSAAEDFTASFKCMKRGVIIGQKTGGSTGNPLGYPLPGGGIGFVCSKRDLMPDGTEFVGIGISPDIEVKESIADIQQGVDLVLQKGIEYIRSRNN